MTELGFATVRFRYPQLTDAELRELALRLFDIAERGAREHIRIPGVETSLELEEGSLTARTRFMAYAAGVVTFLNFYGGIREGADYVARDVLAAGKYVVEHLPAAAGVQEKDVVSSRRSPTLSRRVERILRAVEEGQINAEEGTRRVVRLLEPEDDAAVPPELVNTWEAELNAAQTEQYENISRSEIRAEQPAIQALPPDRSAKYPPQAPKQQHFPHPPRRIEVVREGPERRKVVRRK